MGYNPEDISALIHNTLSSDGEVKCLEDYNSPIVCWMFKIALMPEGLYSHTPFVFCLSFLCRISWLVAIAALAVPPPSPLLPQWPKVPLSSRWTAWWGRCRAPTGPWVASWGLWTVWFSPPALSLILLPSPLPPCPSLVPSATGLFVKTNKQPPFDSKPFALYICTCSLVLACVLAGKSSSVLATLVLTDAVEHTGFVSC